MDNFINRRRFLAGSVAGTGAAFLAGCGNGVNSAGAPSINTRVEKMTAFMFAQQPQTRELAAKASGMLVMPLVTQAGFGVGGSYGKGALRINDRTVDFYSATSASAGFQIGAQQLSYTLFFMTPDALAEFRGSSGWVAGANIHYVISTQSDGVRAETLTARAPVIAVVFAQAGLKIGAALEGTKYTRIIP